MAQYADLHQMAIIQINQESPREKMIRHDRILSSAPLPWWTTHSPYGLGVQESTALHTGQISVGIFQEDNS